MQHHYCFLVCKGTKPVKISVSAYDVMTNKKIQSAVVVWKIVYPPPEIQDRVNTNALGKASLTTLYPCDFIMGEIEAYKHGYMPFKYLFLEKYEYFPDGVIDIPISPYFKVRYWL